MLWRGHRKSRCSASTPTNKHLHLIVVTDRTLCSPTRRHGTRRRLDQWQSWRTASWSKDRHSYVLTGLSTPAFVKKFRKDRRWDWGG